MNKYLSLLLIVSSIIKADYSPLKVYGDTLCNIIMEYVQKNDGQTSSDVLNFINSPATDTVFSDGKKSGYEREEVLLTGYQTSFTINPPVTIIIDGLHDALEQERAKIPVTKYIGWATTGASSALLLYMGGFSWLYFKKDRPAINFYKSNHHRYTTGNPTLSVNTNTNSTTPLIVAEPWFPAGT